MAALTTASSALCGPTARCTGSPPTATCISQGEGDERRPIRFIGVNREITAEKQAQEALRESQERLATFAAATFEGIILSERGRIADCNEQFAQMVGSTVRSLWAAASSSSSRPRTASA